MKPIAAAHISVSPDVTRTQRMEMLTTNATQLTTELRQSIAPTRGLITRDRRERAGNVRSLGELHVALRPINMGALGDHPRRGAVQHLSSVGPVGFPL